MIIRTPPGAQNPAPRTRRPGPGRGAGRRPGPAVSSTPDHGGDYREGPPSPRQPARPGPVPRYSGSEPQAGRIRPLAHPTEKECTHGAIDLPEVPGRDA